MKSFSLFLIFASLISLVFAEADNYEITYYGCPDECYAQQEPACDGNMKLGNHEYFAALSVDFDYDRYCFDYVVAMRTDGSKKMIKAKIVDSCGNCSKYHVDLSETAFTALASKKDGIANIIWGVFSKDGKKLAGPYENKAHSAAEKFKMSSSSFIEAFNKNAEKLAVSSSNTRDFDASDRKTTTTTKKTTTTTKKTTTSTTITTSIPSTTIVESTTAIETMTEEAPKATPATQKQTKPEINSVVESEKKEEESKGNYTAGIITAVGCAGVGCAGVGLFFLKKKNPTQYEDLKQKFPEAFTTVKRGLTRSATQIKNKMTKKTPKQPTLPMNNEYIYTAPANLITF